MNLKMRFYGSALSLADVDPNNSYGWKLSFKKGGIYSFVISFVGVPHLGARIRHRILTKILKGTKNKELVLDVGCGFGLESLYLSNKGYSIWGLDKSKAKIEIARKLAKELKDTKIKFVLSDLYKFESDKKFDKVILFEVLEHVKNPEKMFSKISGFLKKEGVLVVSVPSIHWINAMFKNSLGHEVVGYDLKFLRKLAKKNGMRIQKIKGFGNSLFAKTFFFMDSLLLRFVPFASAAFFFLSYPIVVFDQKLFKNKNPLGYILILRKEKK